MTAARLPGRTYGSQEPSLRWEWVSHSGVRAVAGSWRWLGWSCFSQGWSSAPSSWHPPKWEANDKTSVGEEIFGLRPGT